MKPCPAHPYGAPCYIITIGKVTFCMDCGHVVGRPKAEAQGIHDIVGDRIELAGICAADGSWSIAAHLLRGAADACEERGKRVYVSLKAPAA